MVQTIITWSVPHRPSSIYPLGFSRETEPRGSTHTYACRHVIQRERERFI